MHKGVIKTAVLTSVFFLSVLVFGKLMNHVNEDLTTEMSNASLPVISLYENGTEINELHGYSVEMNAAYMRDAITPIGSDRKLPISIQTYQTAVDTISYEIRSLDAKRLIADAIVSSYEEKRGKISAELTIQNLLDKNEEYLLIIKLESGDQPVYYYTRIIEPENKYVDDCVKFALDFNNKTFNSETSGTLSGYMEKMTGDNTTLHYADLHSSIKQIGWAEFGGERLTTPIPSVKEITDTYNVIVLDYVITRINENGESEYYNVEEYYRVKYGEKRAYLLDFERVMNQIFRGENDSIFENNIRLGIRSGDVEYKANEAGSSVAFVQEGELWRYNGPENTLSKVFSFRGYEGIDNRENYGEHGIKIVSIDEAGSVDYIVYGYMNRGIHEGQVGMTVYHYDSLSNTNEELAFIPSDKSYEILKSELGQLMYENESGELFLMVDGTIYEIDLKTLNERVLVTGLSDEDFAVSSSNRFVAWIAPDGQKGTNVIQIRNFSNGTTTEIEEDAGVYVKPLGFIGEDFVYGVVHENEVLEDAAGNMTFPMYKVKIMDISGERPETLKTYEKSGYYISGIEIDNYTMYLNRMQFNGSAYVETDQDMIMNREGDSSHLVDIKTVNAGDKQTEVQIVLPLEALETTPKLLTPRETILEEDRTVALKDENTSNRYYVYVKGDVLLATDDVAEAIIAANDRKGVVIGEEFRYVWKRSNKTVQGAFKDISIGAEDTSAGSIAQCINAMLQMNGLNMNVSALIDGGETPKNILNNTLKDHRVFDLTGCSVEEVLYYVGCGNPVFAMTGSNDAVLITGYDKNSVAIFNPVSGVTEKVTAEAADELFQAAGNVFFSYLDK